MHLLLVASSDYMTKTFIYIYSFSVILITGAERFSRARAQATIMCWTHLLKWSRNPCYLECVAIDLCPQIPCSFHPTGPLLCVSNTTFIVQSVPLAFRWYIDCIWSSRLLRLEYSSTQSSTSPHFTKIVVNKKQRHVWTQIAAFLVFRWFYLFAFLSFCEFLLSWFKYCFDQTCAIYPGRELRLRVSRLYIVMYVWMMHATIHTRTRVNNKFVVFIMCSMNHLRMFFSTLLLHVCEAKPLCSFVIFVVWEKSESNMDGNGWTNPPSSLFMRSFYFISSLAFLMCS